ncbi:MAG: tetratricopeptide repeat protein [Rhodobacteraceae bacterium]|nr:tetratricopeptide repeat protein [Paracoccaceae bacterium]
MRQWVGLIALTTALAACQTGNTGLQNNRVGIAPPPGTPVVRDAVDGLVVGHRLMAAGEYDLALSAYTRAAGEHGLTADVLSALGSANLKLGRLNQARQLLENAVERDPEFVAAWNNLGVVLMEQGEDGAARRAFRNAFALDNGNSVEIRENLRLAIAKSENTAYAEANENKFELVRRGSGQYLLLQTPASDDEQ